MAASTRIPQPNPQPQTATPATGGGQNSQWDKMLMQMMMAQRMGSRGMAGLALGQILAALLKNWKQNYDARGAMRAEWEPLTPEERAQRLAEIRQKDPAKAAEDEAFMQKRGFDFGATPQAQPQPQITPQTTPQVSNPISQAAQQLMPSTDWQQQGLLGTEDDWKRWLGGGLNAAF